MTTPYHFGFNCSNYIPNLKKCVEHVERYGKMVELIEDKEYPTKEMMAYLGLSGDELIKKIKMGEIRIKRKKKVDEKYLLIVSSAHKYDDCPLADIAGICFYFKEHNGTKISYMADKNNIEENHPNNAFIPTDDYVLNVERKISELLKNNDL